MTDDDMTESLAAKSDQLNSADLSGPITVTIKEVVRTGNPKQPFAFHLEGMPGRPYLPNKGMRRFIVACWGPKTGPYTGRQMTLFSEPSVIYAGEEIGGIRISHLSHIEEPVKRGLVLNQKQRTQYTVYPLVESAPTEQPTLTDRVTRVLAWFDSKGISQAQVEAHVGLPMAEWTAEHLAELNSSRESIVAEGSEGSA